MVDEGFVAESARVLMRKGVEALFARRLELTNRHDVEALGGQYAPDGVVESPTAGGTVVGGTRSRRSIARG
jgi:hypothetical protein